MLPKLALPPLNIEQVIQPFTETEVYDWGLRDVHIPLIHRQTLGEDIKIAVIDSGQCEHFETQHAFYKAKNFSSSPTVLDKIGHSTFLSGILAAKKDGIGIVGVAPKAKLYYAKAIDDNSQGDPSALVNAIKWCISEEVDIITISAGMFYDFKPLGEVVGEAYKQNIIITAAVGNTGNRHFDVAYPARYPEVIGVGAYDQKHKVAPFSSRGIHVKFVMPGVNIFSTWLDNQYVRASGSSFSCPMLTGICALILANHRKRKDAKTPCNTPDEMIEHLKKYSIKLDNDPYAAGFGTVDLRNMMRIN